MVPYIIISLSLFFSTCNASCRRLQVNYYSASLSTSTGKFTGGGGGARWRTLNSYGHADHDSYQNET